MGNISRESENEAVKKTLESSYCPELLRQARERQDRILNQQLRPGPYKIADIGCGNGYHAVLLAPSALLYHGFELSPAIADTARALWKKENIDHAQVFVGDVDKVELQDEFYDVVLCLYFTPGNFRDQSEDLGFYSDAYLDGNPQFIGVVSRFYQALKSGGSIFLTIYKDVPEAEATQIDYYENTGQHVVTPPGSRFVATAEGFWSVRWTQESMLSNLSECGIGPNQVVFGDLNAIAWLVEIKK
ncbi:MAG: methyltransferase domain-containing protein [Candidatus Latescibacteria bacterium]|nr:methyltransferase domain-containing protein [Candidatus Latescibacterota bacterium]